MTISDLCKQTLFCAYLATDKKLLWILYNIEYLTLNSGNATLQTFNFPGTMLVPKVHAHSSEWDQLPKELNPAHHT